MADDTTLDSLPEANPTSATVAHLAQNPLNPRYGYEDISELIASLKESGQLQSITVVQREIFLAHYPDHGSSLDPQDAYWIVINGNRRLAAARKAKLGSLAITVQDRLGGNDDRIPEAALIENIHRQSLPPLLEARELEGLVKRHGSQSAVARRLAKTQGWVSQRLSLLKLAPEIQEQLRDNTITVEDARMVAGTPVDQQASRLQALLRRNSAPPDAADAESAKPSKNGTTKSKAGSANGVARKSIRVEHPEDTATDLRKHLSPKQLRSLASILRRNSPG